MDKGGFIGAGKQIAGSTKEGVGKLVGDTRLQANGKAIQVEGKLQSIVGGVKDMLPS